MIEKDCPTCNGTGKIQIVSADSRLLYKYIGSRIKAERERQSLRQEELATSIGMERTSITNIEAGRQKAPLETLMKIAEYLGIDYKSLF